MLYLTTCTCILKKYADRNIVPARFIPSDNPPQPAKISRVARELADITVSFLSARESSSQIICFPLSFFEVDAFLVRVMVGSYS
jgi:hypothetical protein